MRQAIAPPSRSTKRLALAGAAAALLAGCATVMTGDAPAPDTEWRVWGGSPAQTHYSELTQIHPGNVDQLEVAWTYDIGSDISISNPLMIGGRVYLIGAGGAIVALDAATGAEIWKLPGQAPRGARGLAYWSSPDGADQRIIYNKDNFMRGLDARTGRPIEGFAVDLRQGMERDPATITTIQSNAPGTVYGDLIITGALTGEDYDAPPGDIRAFNVRTGELAWTFRPMPRPGEPGAETWGPNPRADHGGANNWTGFTLDERRGIVYAVTGSSTYDFWGVDRPGNNLYANSIIALDARTGRRLWHFQTVHHDLWDWDIPTPPVLLTVRHEGRTVDAVVVAGKTGFLYAFDRVSGEPLWPIEERPVPTRGVEGEWVSPTQPFPTKLKPFARQSFTIDDIDPSLPADEREELVARMKAARDEGLFTPPDVIDTVQMPGNIGATNWGMLTGDPKTGMAYVISTDVPSIIKLQQVSRIVAQGATPYERGKAIYAQVCSACHGAERQGSDGAPSLLGVSTRLAPDVVSGVVQRGRGHMPAFPQVSGPAMGELMAYLAENRNARGASAPESAAGAVKVEAQPARWRTDYGYVISRTTGNPMIKPPWSQVTAYDMNTGEIAWQRPIGDDPDYKGPRNGPTGSAPARIGSALTASGLMFVATAKDRTLHALDSRTGKTLWTGALPGTPAGLPSIYAAGGRQFVLVPAASSRPAAPGQASPLRNAFVAYALPRTAKR